MKLEKVVAAMLCGIGLSAAFCATASAQCATPPNSLTNGQATDATQVMGNFNHLTTCLNTGQLAVPPVSSLTVPTSGGGNYTLTLPTGPGVSGQFLTTDGTGQTSWMSSSSGAVATVVAQFTSQGTAGDAFASLGYFFTAPLTITVKALSAVLHPGAVGRTYTLNIAPFNPVTRQITAAPTIAGTYTSTGAGSNITVPFNLSVPVTIAAGQTYAIWLSQTFGSTTATPDTYYNTTNGPQSFYFTVPVANGIKLASNAPTTSDVWTAASAAWGVSFLYFP